MQYIVIVSLWVLLLLLNVILGGAFTQLAAHLAPSTIPKFIATLGFSEFTPFQFGACLGFFAGFFRK